MYLGPEVIAGMKFKGAPAAVSLQSLKDGDFATRNDLAVPNGRWSFPLARARVKDEDEDNPHHALPDVGSFTPPEEESTSEPARGYHRHRMNLVV